MEAKIQNKYNKIKFVCKNMDTFVFVIRKLQIEQTVLFLVLSRACNIRFRQNINGLVDNHTLI